MKNADVQKTNILTLLLKNQNSLWKDCTHTQAHTHYLSISLTHTYTQSLTYTPNYTHTLFPFIYHKHFFCTIIDGFQFFFSEKDILELFLSFSQKCIHLFPSAFAAFALNKHFWPNCWFWLSGPPFQKILKNLQILFFWRSLKLKSKFCLNLFYFYLGGSKDIKMWKFSHQNFTSICISKYK